MSLAAQVFFTGLLVLFLGSSAVSIALKMSSTTYKAVAVLLVYSGITGVVGGALMGIWL